MYNSIFFTNVRRILDELKMTNLELSKRSGVSIAFISNLTTGKGNPSLKIMEAIARALEVPLPILLESTDLDQKTLDTLAGGKAPSSLPLGYERVSAILPEHHAFIVKKWAAQSQKKLKQESWAEGVMYITPLQNFNIYLYFIIYNILNSNILYYIVIRAWH